MAIIHDSTDAGDIPHADDGYVFAYNDGLYSQVAAVRARFPQARVITISAVGRASADVVDVEPGCVWPPAGAVAYVRRERAAGNWPTVYCGRANWPAVIGAFQAEGMTQPPYWIAHYTNAPHLCSSSCYPSSVGSLVAVATQYGGDLPGHYDITVTNGSWPDGVRADGSGSPITDPAPLGGALSEEDEGLMAGLPLEQQQEMYNRMKVIEAQVGGMLGLTPEQMQEQYNRGKVIEAGIASLLARPVSAGGTGASAAEVAKAVVDMLDDSLAAEVADLLAQRLSA